MPSYRALRVVGWNVADQALSALSNLGLSIVVARTTTASGFGAFAVAFLLFGITLAVTKSVVGQPLQMRWSGTSAARRLPAFRAGLGAAALLGGAFGLLVLVAGLAVGGDLGGALVALAVVLPGLMLQDSCRMAAFTLGRPQLAALIDAVWTAVQFGLLVILISNGRPQVGGLILAWGGAAAVSALLGLAVLRARPVLSHARAWVTEHRDLIRYLLPEYFLGLGAMQFGILLVGVIASATAVGSLRAAQVLLGPLGIVGAAVFQFAVPEVARRAPATTRWLATLAAGLSGGLGLLTIGYVALLMLLPDAVGVVLFGDSWAGAAAVLLAMGLSSVSSSLANGPAGVLYGLGQARATFRINLAKGPVLLIALMTATYLAGAVGAGWALAAVEALVLPVWITDSAAHASVASGARTRATRPRCWSTCPSRNTGDSGRNPTMTHRSGLPLLRRGEPQAAASLLQQAAYPDLVRARRGAVAEADIIFLNDGPVPADRLAIMERFGRVVQLADEPQGLRASYRAALLLCTTEPWSDDDVVSYVEDDYLFTDDAFLALAAGQRPSCPRSPTSRCTGTVRTPPTPAAGSPTASPATGRRRRIWGRRPGLVQPSLDHQHLQRPGRRAARRPARLLRLHAAVPQALSRPRDLPDLPGLHPLPRPRAAARPGRGLRSLGARRGADGGPGAVPHRVERASPGVVEPPTCSMPLTPNEATHLEHPVISPDQDWEAVAIEVTRWASESGLVGRCIRDR